MLQTAAERTGPSRKTSRVKCKFCGILLDEQPPEEREARSDMASALQNTSTIDFDLLRPVVSRTSEDLPVPG